MPDISALGAGSPLGTLPGSGQVGPGGVEAYFEYNDLIMNDLSNVDKYRVLTIGGFSDADLRQSSEELPDDDGEEMYMSRYGGRTMTMTIRVESYSLRKMRDMWTALKMAFMEIDKDYPLYIRHKVGPNGKLGQDTFINCRKSSSLDGDEGQDDNRFYRQYLVTLRARNPRFYSDSVRTVVIDPDTQNNQNVLNAGTYRAQPVIRFYGPLPAQTLRDNLTGRIFRTKTAIPDGHVWTLDTAKRTFRDQNNANKWGQVHISSNRFLIEPEHKGVTNVSTDAASGLGAASKIEIELRDTWM